MATLADSFLQDLEDLEDREDIGSGHRAHRQVSNDLKVFTILAIVVDVKSPGNLIIMNEHQSKPLQG